MTREDEETYIRTYATGIFILAFLDEWSRVERMGVVAKIYNQIILKHSNFHKQISEVQSKKKKKYSQKCALFIKASAYSVSAWDKVINETHQNEISINTTIHNLYRLNSESFKKLYDLNEGLFKKLDNNKQGVTLQSCRIARILLERLDETIDKNRGEAI